MELDGQKLLEEGVEQDLKVSKRCHVIRIVALVATVAAAAALLTAYSFSGRSADLQKSAQVELLEEYDDGVCDNQTVLQIGEHAYTLFCNATTFHPYGSDDAPPPEQKTAEQCLHWCSHDANCMCVRYNATAGICYKQLNCDSTKFQNSTDIVYVKSWAGQNPVFHTDVQPEVMSPVNSKTTFTVVVLPDTQFMTAADNPWVYDAPRNATPEKLYTQLEWIIANEQTLNIKAIVHLGDFVEQGCPDSFWDIMRPGWSKIHASGIPYSISPGNHDCDHIYECQPAGWDCYNRHMKEYFEDITFPVEYRNPGEHQTMLTKFEALGVKFLLLAVSWGALADEIAWVDKTLTQYADRKVILHTHFVPQAPGLLDVVNKHSNVMLVVQGHLCVTNQEWHKEHGRWNEPQYIENLVDYQCSDNGYLKFYVFDIASNNREFAVTAYSYNPYLKSMRWGQPWTFGFCTGPSSDCISLRTCSETWSDCRNSHCCQNEGETCYVKNGDWAACRPSCKQGTIYDDPPNDQPWSCEEVV